MAAHFDRTAQAVFDKAMYLMDAQNESSGATVTADTKEYQVRAIGILNTLLDAVYPASSTYKAANGERPALPDIKAFTDELDLDARILRDVLPNGLAARLLSEENPKLANFFQETYERNLEEARYRVPAQFEAIDSPYGGLEYGEFANW